MKIQKPGVKDAPKIYQLINRASKEYEVLPRALGYIFENIRDFWVAEEKNCIIGCVALHFVWEDLAEIKSLVVDDDFKGKDIGGSLVKMALGEAEEYRIKKVFVLTFIPDYFKKFGFKVVDKSELPHKIWAECINCPKFPDCNEEAMIKELA
ncbi:MAG: N-acetyltransferase [Candidatus Omnitrophica bacterium]|nr:N-acetyltransferase [Candidatus Omnitrophota bacterium]